MSPTFSSEIAPRNQWNFNSGYCGETSFICAGLRFGQYCSQWTARALASPYPQFEQRSQLLLGSGDDVVAARKMRLQASEFYGVAHDNTPELIVWAKSHLLAGHVPIIGVFNNGIALGEWSPPATPAAPPPGDPDYDHIVPVLAIHTDAPLEESAGRYLPGDRITISDNGLDGPYGSPPRYPFLFSYEVRRFQGTREQADNPKGPIYVLPLARVRDSQPLNYGIAIEGVLDLDGVCIPVRLFSDKEWEPEPKETVVPPDYTSPLLAQPPLADGPPPEPIEIELTAVVYVPDERAYTLYRYDDFAKVPVAGFNAAAHDAAQVWPIPAGSGPTTMVVKYTASSSDTVVFRAVPATAP